MFSVIVPVHNKLPHLDRTINSILSQTFEKFELILIDDASTDGSEERIKEYTDARIRIFKRDTPGPGGYAGRNLGIKKAKYEWIAFLDADDEWSKEYLQEVYMSIKKQSDAEIVSTKWRRVTERIDESCTDVSKKGEIYSEFYLIDYLREPNHVWTGAIVAHKSLINKTNSFPTDKLCKRGGDVDTWIRWLDRSKKNILINKVLSFYHQGTVNQVTGKPNTHFCAYETLKEIYTKNTGNKELKQAVKNFSNRFLYNMLARQVKHGMPINYADLRKFYLDTYSFLRIGKLISMRLKYLIGIKH